MSMKPQEERVTECARVLREMRNFMVPEDTAGYRELRARISEQVKSGEPWQGKIPFPEIERVAQVLLPRPSRTAVEVTLKRA